MSKLVKMSDIAKELGISTVTVSKALSDQKGVSEELRIRIKQVALDLGYRKSVAKTDNNAKSISIGVIVPNSYMTKYETFYWEMYQAVLMNAAEQNSFVMLEALSTEDERACVPPKLLKENRVDAVIILGVLGDRYLKMLREHYSYPTVYLDFYSMSIKEDSVISNSFYGTYQVTNYLFEKGHKKIGFLGSILATSSITDRYFGYAKSLLEHGIEINKEWVIDDRDEERHCYEEVPLPKEMPTAFVCNCDLVATKLINTLRNANYRVPEDVSVVGFDNYLQPGHLDIPLTTYAVDIEAMANSAVKLILKKMAGRETSKGMHMVEGHFIERESVCEIGEKTVEK